MRKRVARQSAGALRSIALSASALLAAGCSGPRATTGSSPTSAGSGGTISAAVGPVSGAAAASAAGAAAGGGGTAAFAGASGATGKGGSGAGAGAGAGAGSGSGGQAGGSVAGAGGGGASGSGGAGTIGTGGAGGAGGTGGAGNTACITPASGSKGMNPLFTDQFTADPAPMVHGCTFYIQCGHDEAAAGQNSFVMKEWFLLSSTDMVHWNKQVALSLKDFSWADANAWAGQMVEKDGKFYWFVPVNERGSGMAIGVAVADSPTGPFKDALGKALIDDAFEMSNMGFAQPSDTPFTIDPTVLVDEDGQAYLHYGGFSRMVVAKLGSDMLSISGKMKEVTPQGYFEAPYLIKRNGMYYEIYAAGSNPATIDYATSNSPLGPFAYRGRVLDAFPRAAGQQDWPTNHSGVAELAGQWYIVYHTSSGPNGGGTYRREVAIDKLNFNADGSIQKVTPSSGLSF